MLAELRIVNFALIEQLHIQFQSGFTVLTGETGAGKSLLIDAIALLVGGRGSAEQIRSGEDEAHLKRRFTFPPRIRCSSTCGRRTSSAPRETDLDSQADPLPIRSPSGVCERRPRSLRVLEVGWYPR